MALSKRTPFSSTLATTSTSNYLTSNSVLVIRLPRSYQQGVASSHQGISTFLRHCRLWKCLIILARSIQGKMLININDHPDIREVFLTN